MFFAYLVLRSINLTINFITTMESAEALIRIATDLEFILLTLSVIAVTSLVTLILKKN